MSRLIALALVVPALAFADVDPEDLADPDALPDQSLGASAGVSGGGNVTPGGFHLAGHWLYQLSDRDWFDGTVGFTFGSGGAGCFRDRMDEVVCDHALDEGRGVEVTAAVRRYFAAQGKFRPFARVGAGVSIVRYGADDLTGLAIPLHGGGGIRGAVSDQIAIVAMAELFLGPAIMGRGLGAQPQAGIVVTAGAEFRLP
jgi:hypothetical protein